MTAPLTLTDFLLARIAEDEEVAREVRDEMRAEIERGVYLPGAGPDPDDSRLRAGADAMDSPAVIAGPARVLAECEAKRRIAAWHEQDVTGSGIECATCGWYPAECGGCETLQLLALPFADHPDYRQEWKP